MEERRRLMRVALGKEKADLVIKDGNLVNVYSGEVLENYSVAIKGGKIAFVGEDANHTIGEETEIIDASGKIVAPGFIDGHFHFMDLSPDEFLKHAIPRGTTTIFTELDLGAVIGYEASVIFMENLRDQPIKFFGLAPSFDSVPSCIDIENYPLSPANIAKLLEREDIIGLGESLSTGVLEEGDRVLSNIETALRMKKKLEGHAGGAKGKNLVGYTAMGIGDCHESINLKEAMERLRLGMHVMMREGSIRRDLEAISRIRDEKIDHRRISFVTDGLDVEDLLSRGHMDYVIQKAVKLGFSPIKAIQMVTLNTAQHFRMDDFIGGIAPGRYADIVILSDLNIIQCQHVICNGKILSKDGKLLLQTKKFIYPESLFKSVQISNFLTPEDFNISAEGYKNEVKVRVMKLITELITEEYQATLPVSNDLILHKKSQDILKISIIDRKSNRKKVVTGFIQGSGLRSGAIACSYTWHFGSPIVVVGTDEKDMACATNRIIELQGGLILANNGEILAEVPLQIGGYLALGSAKRVKEDFNKFNKVARELGLIWSNPYLTLQTLPGPILPFFRICFQGFFEFKNRRVVELIIG